MSLKENKTQRHVNLTNSLSNEEKYFLEPKSPKQRQYEALRAFFVEKLTGKIVAEKFGYTPNAFYVLGHSFRNDLDQDFFLETKPGPKYSRKKDRSKQKVIDLRKKNYSIEDIRILLEDDDIKISTVSIWQILNEEGFGKLPRRLDEELPKRPRLQQAAYADIRQLCLADEREFNTKVAGSFLLFKILSEMNIHKVPKHLKWRGSKMIPSENAFLSSLFLKIIGKKRKSHVMDILFDEGAGLSVGLNELPKRTFISEYSQRITHEKNMEFLSWWLKELRKTKALSGESINLDFQSLPYFGEENVVEKHYVSMRSRRQKAILVFFAQDAESKIFCYGNADLRKGDEMDEIFRFIDFWKKQTGKIPPHLVFDSKLTTYANLSKLNKMGITFVTLRRRSPVVMREIANVSPSAWRQIELRKVERKYRNPKVLDKETNIQGYVGSIRQIFIKDLGHDLPTILITNDKKTSSSELITRYALRMLIENSIANGVNFFHTTALSSSVAIRIDFDVLLTLIGQATYHLLAQKLRGYEKCGADVVFRKFIDVPGKIYVGEKEIEVRLNKRATNPILLDSGLLNSSFKLPWVPTNKKFIITVQ